MEDIIEDPSNLRSNPSEEGEIDAGAYNQGHPKGHQGQEDQDQGVIQALFSFTSSRVCLFWGTNLEVLNKS